MRVLFDEHNDFERHLFPNQEYFKALSQELLKQIKIEEVEKQRCCITALLPYPRANVYHAIASQLGDINWITYADAAEFRAEELTRYFACYAPRVLIGSSHFLTACQDLSPQCWLKLEATVCTDGIVKIANAKTYQWNAKLSHSGIIQEIAYVD
jgi:hypothetical protein